MSKIISIQGDVIGAASQLQTTGASVDTSVGAPPTATGMVLTSLAGNVTAEWAALPAGASGDMIGPGPTTSINSLVAFAGTDGLTTIDTGITLDMVGTGLEFSDVAGLVTSFAPAVSGVGLGRIANPFDSLVLVNTITANLGTPSAGLMKYNSSNSRMEYADGTSWNSMKQSNILNVRTVSGTDTVLSTDELINMNVTTVVALTLPSAVSSTGKVLTIISRDTGTTTLTAAAAQFIVNGGVESSTLDIVGVNTRVQVVSNGIKWYVM